MKIALIAPVEESIPPKKYGGTEWVVYNIAHGLGKRNHEVDLYASGDSKKESNYNIIQITPRSLRAIPKASNDIKLRDTMKILAVSNALISIKKKKYDIINNHASWRFLLFANQINPKPITTHHMPLSLKYQQVIFNQHKTLGHIALSNNQKKDQPSLNFLATIHNGIDLSYYPINQSQNQQENLIFLGRISENKGACDAAAIARKLRKSLTVVAKVDTQDQEYFKKFEPFTKSPYVNFLGEIPHGNALKLLAKAKALIMPISYEDPCPLGPLEAMANGTPVIAYSLGALPEQVVDGKTGFLVNYSKDKIRGNFIIKKTGIEGLKEAVRMIYDMNDTKYKEMRQNCRKHIENNFSVERMIDQYEEVFENSLKTHNQK